MSVLTYFALNIGKLLLCWVAWRKVSLENQYVQLALKELLYFFLSEIGLTALRSDEVIDLMIKEYPAKHAEYSVILQEKERQLITDHYKEYSVSIEVTRILVWEITFYKVRCDFQL